MPTPSSKMHQRLLNCRSGCPADVGAVTACLSCLPPPFLLLQVLLAYITLVRWDLRPFVQLLATDAGVKAVALVAAFVFLNSRAAQLRIQVGRDGVPGRERWPSGCSSHRHQQGK